jgi:hypothetical protein
MISPLIAETRSTDLEIARSAVGMMTVETESELLERTGSKIVLVMEAVFTSDPEVAMTRQVSVIEPVAPLARSPALKVNVIPLKEPVEDHNHVNQSGSVSVIMVPIAASSQEFP